MIINSKSNRELLERLVEEGNVLPFVFNRKTPGGDYAWTTVPRMLDSSLDTPLKRLNYFHNKVRSLGLDEPIMADQPDPDIEWALVHEITADEIDNQYSQERAKEEGSIWNIDKPYSAIFMTKDTHDRVLRDKNKDLCIVDPIADCVDIRLYNKENGIIGTVHSSAIFSTHDLILKSMDFAKNHFGISADNWIAVVGPYASSNWYYYDNIPRFATLVEAYFDENAGEKGKWKTRQILRDGKPIILPEWKDYLYITEEDGRKVIRIDYRKKTEDQIRESGLLAENVVYSADCTIDDESYYSNARRRITGEREGRNLMGIAFTHSPKGKELLRKARDKKNGIIVG